MTAMTATAKALKKFVARLATGKRSRRITRAVTHDAYGSPSPILAEILTMIAAGIIPGGAGTALISRALVIGLVPNDPSQATAIANAALIQSALDKQGHVYIMGAPGNYYISTANLTTAAQILTIGSDTDLDGDIGINLVGPSLSDGACLPLMTNKNWRSNKKAVTSITSTTTTAPYVTTATVRCVGHNFTVGKRVLLKGCTGGSRVYNDIWRVMSVGIPTADDFTIVMYGYTTAPVNGAGTMIAYEADANFKVGGGITLDAQRNTNTSGLHGELGKMATIFNKVADCTLDLAVVGAAKYGSYVCNSFRTKHYTRTSAAPSNALQFVGPCVDIWIGQGFGAEGDDIVAILTNNTGYEFYALKDADATQNSDGDIDGFMVADQSITAGGSRTITLCAGTAGAIRKGKIKDTRRRTSKSGLYMVIETSPAETGVYENIEVDGLGGPSPLNQAFLFIGSQSTSTTVLRDFKVRGLYSRGGDINGTSSFGFTGPAIAWGPGGGSVDGFLVENPNIDYDQTNGSNGCSLVSIGAGANVVTMKGLKVVNPTLTGTGTVRGLTVVDLGANAKVDDPILILNAHVTGFYASLMSDGSTQTGKTVLEASNCALSKGANSQGQAYVVSTGGRSMSLMFSNMVHDHAVSGVLQVYGGSGKTFDIFWNNLRTSNKFFDFNGSTSHTINVYNLVGCMSDNFTAQGGALVNNYGTTCTWNFFGNCSNIGVDLSKITRQAGTQIVATGTNGTIVNGNLATCDTSNTTGSWKQATNTALMY